MNKRFADWPVRHSAQALLILLLLVALGIAFVARVPMQRLPSSPGVMLRVQAELPGFDATQTEAMLAQPLEESLISLAGLRQITTRSRDGRAFVELQFGSATEREAAIEQVRQRLTQISVSLPSGMDMPTVERRDPAPQPAAVYAITANDLSGEIESWVEQKLARPLQEFPEVSSAVIDGSDAQEVLIQPDTRRLAALGLSLQEMVQALRRGDEAPRRRNLRRRTTVMPASVEAIAARAVRLPDGESMALAEVAEVSVKSKPALDPLNYQGKPALVMRVYPRSALQAPAVAERVDAHLGWLAANGLVQPGVEIHSVLDESRELRGWFRKILRFAGLCVGVTLLAMYLCFGGYACFIMVCGLIVWLPASITMLGALGFTLNAMSIMGLMLAWIPLTLMMVRSLRPMATFGLVAITILWAWLTGETFSHVQTAMVFSMTALLAGCVSWLITPWIRADRFAAPPARLLPLRWRLRFRPSAAVILGILVSGVVAVSVRALPVVTTGELDRMLILRVHGDDPQQLAILTAQMLPQVHAMAGLEKVSASTEPTEQWQLQLDGARLEDRGIGVAEVARAFAIARDGLIVGEVADADRRMRLRLQLEPGTAGLTFERLLLRGEQPNQPAVYLRDVGVAQPVTEFRERLRVQQMPAVEISARWRAGQTPPDLTSLHGIVLLPPGYSLSWEVVPAGPDDSGSHLP